MRVAADNERTARHGGTGLGDLMRSAIRSGRADPDAPGFSRLVDRAKDEAQVTGREAPRRSSGNRVFRVQSFGMGRYPYRLDHEHGVIAATDSEKLPAVQDSAPGGGILHGVGAWAAGRLVSWRS